MPKRLEPPAAMFLGLEPDARSSEVVCDYKRRVRALSGPQVFLEHPPHLTLYLGLFGDADAAVAATEPVATSAASVNAQVVGWHTFWADPLTGRNTLVCQLDDAAVGVLRAMQTRIVEAVAPLRNVAATKARYANRRALLSPQERTSIERTGFPYTGEHWHPHLTIASIAVADWPAIEREVLPDVPSFAVTFSTLTCYRLFDEHPVPLRSFALRRPGAAIGHRLPLAS